MPSLSRYLRTVLLGALTLLGGVSVSVGAEFSSPPTTVVATATTGLNLPNGSSYGTIFSVDVTAIGAGDTWTFKLQRTTLAGTIDLTATSANVTATGITNFVLASPYATSTAVPWPTQVVATNTVDGGAKTITYRIRVVGINEAGWRKPQSQELEVCTGGCQYTSIAAALAALPTTSTTNRWTINVGPGTFTDAGATAVSYVTVKGSGAATTIYDTDSAVSFTIPDTVTEFAVEDLTVIQDGTGGEFGTSVGAPASRRNIYIRNCILGTWATSQDGFVDSFGSTNWYVENTIIRGKFDMFRVTGPDISIFAKGNFYDMSQTPMAGAGAAVISIATAGAGVQYRDQGSRAIITTATAADHSFLLYNVSSGTDTQPTVFDISGLTIELNSTFNNAGNVNPACFKFQGSTTLAVTSPAPVVRLSNIQCKVTADDQSGTSTTNGLWIFNDADFAPWDFKWIGGGVNSAIPNNAQCTASTVPWACCSGAGTGTCPTGPNFIRNLQAGTTVTTTGVVNVNSGAITTATGPVVAGGPNFITEADLVAATCVVGEVKADTAGGTHELCWCIAGPAWACVSATTATGPTN